MFHVIWVLLKLLFPAILELKQPADFTRTVKPICMPHWATKPYHNDAATIAGWGRVARPWETKLTEAGVQIWSHEFCSGIIDEQKTENEKPWHTVTK